MALPLVRGFRFILKAERATLWRNRMIDPNRPPSPKPGYRWEYRAGCQCKDCPWKGNCRGEDWPHWYGVKEDIAEKRE